MSLAAACDGLVRSLASDPLGRLPSPRTLVLAILVAGPIYGLFMGSFAMAGPERFLFMLYSAAKMPLLLFATTAICLPGFFVINTAAGLRSDFPAAMRAILAGQAGLTVALASLGPVTRFIYWSGVDHRAAILTNAAMFTVATAAGHFITFRRYRPLVARAPAHGWVLWLWVALYAFVGMQAGWMLRPFVGKPGSAAQFVRNEPFSNAYVVIVDLILR